MSTDAFLEKALSDLVHTTLPPYSLFLHATLSSTSQAHIKPLLCYEQVSVNRQCFIKLVPARFERPAFRGHHRKQGCAQQTV